MVLNILTQYPLPPFQVERLEEQISMLEAAKNSASPFGSSAGYGSTSYGSTQSSLASTAGGSSSTYNIGGIEFFNPASYGSTSMSSTMYRTFDPPIRPRL